ncbi:MAG TPA: discoidin domain-containing protein, partial [Polyangiaceae bacterium]|nr:discoidin domain-containing protein [Polyangiaceae bacterium]
MQAQKPLRWAVALLLLAGCDRVIGLRSDYFLTAGTAGVGGAAGADNAGGTNALGGALDANGGTAGVGGSSDTNGGTGAAIDGGGASMVDAGASTGGATGKLLCADLPITAESGWVVSASPDDPKYPPSAVTDGAPTRWSTGHAQEGGEWLQIDFGQPVSVRRVNLQQGSLYSNDYPRMYEV